MVYIITWSKEERDTSKTFAMKFAAQKARELGAHSTVEVTQDDGDPQTCIALWHNGIRYQGWKKKL